MGLDITFNLAAAVKAGMTVIKETNGTEEEILQAENDYVLDPTEINEGILNWLKEELLLGKLPSYLHFFTVDTCNEYAQVRANKGRSLYAPLTAFLKTNNITWEEY